MCFFAAFFAVLFIPSVAEAWGPLTHVYLASQVINLGAVAMPASIYWLLKKYKNDFLYGNLCADMILGKRFHGLKKNSHSWDVAWKLFGSADTAQQTAFSYGYLTHLGADTVVHNLGVSSVRFSHSLLELKSDSIIDKKYRHVLKRFDRCTQKRNDIFLENVIESVFFSFKTNKRIFKSFLVLSKFPNYAPVSSFIEKRLPEKIPVNEIYRFRRESLDRMMGLLKDGEGSDVLTKSPLKQYRRVFGGF